MITDPQKKALKWLHDHGGDACFDKNGIAFARGETAGVLRLSWNHLERVGLIEFYKPTGKGRGRLRITPAGASFVSELRR